MKPNQEKNVIVVIGPGPVFKGGLANYTVSLCRAFTHNPDNQVHLVSWTHQYPFIIPRDFKDRVSKDTSLAKDGIVEKYIINYNNPLTWGATVRYIKGLKPSKVVVQWSIALQGLPLGRIAAGLAKAGIPVYFDLHFVRQKEASALDGILSKYALRKAGGYVVHSQRTAGELAELLPEQRYKVMESNCPTGAGEKPVIKLFHPIYDIFKEKSGFDAEAWKKEHGLKKHVFLFFGFIRKYKGLHFCIEAFRELAAKRDDVSLLIVGESFWKTLDETKLSTKIKSALFKAAKSLVRKEEEDESQYNPLALIDQYGLSDKVVVVNEFVANDAVYQYFQASDALLLLYEYATPSGVESMAYNFKVPILATGVGHFPETIAEGTTGYLAKPADTHDMALVMERFLEQPIPKEKVDAVARHWTWTNYARAIEGCVLANS